MWSFLLSFILCLICSDCGSNYQSYDSSNCAFVYDSDDDFQASFPLDVCITDYDKDDDVYQSRQYVCALNDDGSANITAYTFYAKNCSGSFDKSRSVLVDDDNAYRCGDGESQTYDACYLEYREYDLEDSSSCDDYAAASYHTKYVIVGVCVPASRKYFRCTNHSVDYVAFTDDECCDLDEEHADSFDSYWTSTDLQGPICDTDNGIFIGGWKCMMPHAVDDEEVFTDNTNKKCIDDTQSTADIYDELKLFGYFGGGICAYCCLCAYCCHKGMD